MRRQSSEFAERGVPPTAQYAERMRRARMRLHPDSNLDESEHFNRGSAYPNTFDLF